MKQKTVYLDYAAAAPVDERVAQAMAPFWSERFYNPSSLYDAARAVRRELEATRGDAAEVLGAKKSEIVFTAGGTESVNLAVLGLARRFPGAHLSVSAIEHDGVLAVAAQAEREGHKLTFIPCTPGGVVEPKAVNKCIDDETVLVAVMYANNETGTIQPLAKIAAMLADIRRDRAARGVNRPLYLFTDASQAAGRLDLHVSRLGVDLMTLNGGKIYGPKQSGALYVRTGVELEPVIYGGGQERGLRGGTESVAAAVGFSSALKLVAEDREAESARLRELRGRLWQAIKAELPDAEQNGDPSKSLASHLNFRLPGLNGEDAVAHLDQAGIQVSTGSACSTGDTDPSHVLLALGLTPEEANSSLRLSLGRQTSAEDIDYAAAAIPKVLKNLRMLK